MLYSPRASLLERRDELLTLYVARCVLTDRVCMVTGRVEQVMPRADSAEVDVGCNILLASALVTRDSAHSARGL